MENYYGAWAPDETPRINDFDDGGCSEEEELKERQSLEYLNLCWGVVGCRRSIRKWFRVGGAAEIDDKVFFFFEGGTSPYFSSMKYQ